MRVLKVHICTHGTEWVKESEQKLFIDEINNNNYKKSKGKYDYKVLEKQNKNQPQVLMFIFVFIYDLVGRKQPMKTVKI